MMSKPRRVHPLAIIPFALQFMKNALIPIVVGSFSLIREHPFLTILGAFGVLLLTGFFGALAWYNFTYSIEGGELRVQKGLLNKQRRYIPLERIQSIDISAGIIFQLVGLVKLQVETASDGKLPEISLAGIKKQEAEELKRMLNEAKLAGKAEKQQGEAALEEQAEAVAETPKKRYTLTPKRLILMALTSSSLGLFAPVLSTITEPLVNFIDYFVNWFDFASFDLAAYKYVALGVVIAALSVVGSLVATILAYARFTLTRQGDELKISRGLLEKRELTLPLNRLQGIRIVEGILRQPFGFVTVHVESGGYGKNQGQSTVIFPMVKRSELPAFLEDVLPEFRMSTDLAALPKRAKRRYAFRASLFSIVPIGVLTWFFFPYGLFGLVLIPLLVGLGFLQHREAGWAMREGFYTIRSRTIARTTVVIPRRKVQSFHHQQSLFQKRARLATASVRITSGGIGKTFKIVDLEQDVVFGK
ncbi:PH domain-containing protein [Tumebacillus lipolyticus]|uniref:PH domain-containing protein n=1 Tax=Tumebacillus lipolyticus TaxID=1280370 RepID=A0ABW5A2H4_9BACL